ncbi:MAG: hypothetical protein KF716_15915 [Anaerolineae bacterium]|nr:hypothetical protein [Anaerolineae bacterium]
MPQNDSPFLTTPQPFYRLAVLLTLVIVLAACQSGAPSNVNSVTGTVVGTPAGSGIDLRLPTLPPTPVDPGLLAIQATPDLAKLPLLSAYLQRVQAVLQQPIPIMTLTEGLDEAQAQAQKLAVNDQRFQGYLRDEQTQAALRNEIFGVYPMRASDVTQQIAACATDTCYRVEMYNYAMNFYLAAVVDMQQRAVLNVYGFENTQPDVPPYLTNIALEIATHAPEVKQALGFSPDAGDAIYSNIKTALNGTICERSRHLCVAPTFIVGERALWAIVDLTEGSLIGVRWTELGNTRAVTEKELENKAISRRYCQQETTLEQDGWRLKYTLTSSDGLRISDVSFNNVPFIDSAKLVDWHISYSVPDGFGYSDAVGCPVFSQAAVIAVQPPTVENIVENGEVVGFRLKQDFWSELWPQACNYFYAQRYEFYRDGRFRPIASNVGRGCGDNGTYRPVTRIALAQKDYTFSQWNGSAWEAWQHEDWRLASKVSTTSEGYQFRFANAAGGYYIEPATGQFGNGERGDNPYVFVTLRHSDKDEGDADMPTIGPCCNTDYRQGPEKFIDPTPEPITDSQLVLWYVPQIRNDDTKGSEYCWAEMVLENGIYVPKEYPCYSGPMLVPLTGSAAPTATP